MSGILAFACLVALYGLLGFEQTLIIILAYIAAIMMNYKRGD